MTRLFWFVASNPAGVDAIAALAHLPCPPTLAAIWEEVGASAPPATHGPPGIERIYLALYSTWEIHVW